MFRLFIPCILIMSSLASSLLAQQKEWPYRLPVKPAIPAVTQAEWKSNDIDAFVLKALQERQLQPAERAERRVRLRLSLIHI